MNRKSRKKKSGFLTFCFSFLPGAGEMYLGFMKMGVSLMGLFFALIMLAAVLNMPAILFVLAVVWFYSFFHVHNLAGLTDEEFLETEDVFLFHLDAFFGPDGKNIEKYRKTIAIVLIAIGALFFWNGMKDLLFSFLPDAVWRFLLRMESRVWKILVGSAIVVGGIRMIAGKKEELKEVIVDVESTVQDADEGRKADAGYGEAGPAEVIYGVDTAAGASERSGHGEGQEH